MDPTCSIGEGGGSPLLDLSAVTHSAPKGVRDRPLLCFMTHERVFFAPTVPQPVMHQDSDGARKGNMKLSLCKKA